MQCNVGGGGEEGGGSAVEMVEAVVEELQTFSSSLIELQMH